MLKLPFKDELIVKTDEPTLQDAFDLAAEFGELKTGGPWGKNSAEIQMGSVGEHYISIKSRHKPTLIRNIMECVSVCRALRSVL